MRGEAPRPRGLPLGHADRPQRAIDINEKHENTRTTEKRKIWVFLEKRRELGWGFEVRS
jgi:hypothetical protein